MESCIDIRRLTLHWVITSGVVQTQNRGGYEFFVFGEGFLLTSRDTEGGVSRWLALASSGLPYPFATTDGSSGNRRRKLMVRIGRLLGFPDFCLQFPGGWIRRASGCGSFKLGCLGCCVLGIGSSKGSEFYFALLGPGETFFASACRWRSLSRCLLCSFLLLSLGATYVSFFLPTSL